MTSINVPHVLATYAMDRSVDIVIAADMKTPPEAEAWVVENCPPASRVSWLSPDDQRVYKSSELTGFNTDSRRNFAVLEALKRGAEIIVSVDDDMLGLDGNFFDRYSDPVCWKFHGIECGHPGRWFDAGKYTIPAARSRGIPVDAPIVEQFSPIANAKIGAMQGIILGTPDSDAITAIAVRPVITGVHEILRNGFVVHPKALTVFNSQITAFRRELAPCFGQFYKWHGRNTDIFASMIMRRVMLELGLHTFYGPPMAFHARAKRPLFNDLKAEMFGLTHIEELAEYLMLVPLPSSGSVVDWYRILVEGCPLFDSAREVMLAWADDVESVL